MRDKLRRELTSMFWEPGIDYAVMTYPDTSTTEEELLIQQELWLKLNKAYQQAVNDVVEYILDNYNIVELPVKEKLENLKESETPDFHDINVLKVKIEEIYKDINDTLLSQPIFVNNNVTRLWIAKKLRENFGSQVAILCNESNNPTYIIEQNLLIARITWNSDYSKVFQTKYIEFIFGKKDNVDKYQTQHYLDNETFKFIEKGI